MAAIINFFIPVLAFCALLENTAFSQTRLGLHVTQEELNIWRQRAVSGPYKSAGDVRPNTPGDWDRIIANKNSFMSNPSADLWDGYTGTGCVPRGDVGPRYVALNLRDAAFFALVENDATVANRVRLTLLAQIAKPGTDFSNRSKWCRPPGSSASISLLDTDPSFSAAGWITRLLYACDYVKGFIGSTDQANLEAWFADAAEYFQYNSTYNVITDNYGSEANFLNGILSSGGTSRMNLCGPSARYGQTHINGDDICSLGTWFNNRRWAQITYYGLVGHMLENSQQQNWAHSIGFSGRGYERSSKAA